MKAMHAVAQDEIFLTENAGLFNEDGINESCKQGKLFLNALV